MARVIRRSDCSVEIASWPAPDVTGFSTDKRALYEKRRRAVEAYAAATPHKLITQETGVSRAEAHRMYKRCMDANDTGKVIGFYACLPWFRLRCAPQSSNNKFQNFLRKYPEIRQVLKDTFFKLKPASNMHESMISRADLHAKFLKLAVNAGVKDNEWPFNTDNKGYKTICKYLVELSDEFPDAYAIARLGHNAAKNRRIGKGIRARLRPMRALSTMQLDYHLIDAASVISITNKYGHVHSHEVPRWYFGLMCDEYSSLICGYFIAIESNPSGDTALETISRAVIPETGIADDPYSGLFAPQSLLPNTIFPLLAFLGFSVLKMDNAWANAASPVVNVVMETLGSAINFGPKSEWWRRPNVERIFKTLTERGLQRLPSTYGDNINDPSRNDPAKQAEKFKISITDLIQIIVGAIFDHNNDVNSGKEATSPLQIIQGAMSRPRSGFIRQVLPKAAMNSPKLLIAPVECVIRGNKKKGVRPYVDLDRCRYTNLELSGRDELIGKILLVYVLRNDVCRAYGTLKESGEDLGLLNPDSKWSDPVSVRYRKMINKEITRKRFVPRHSAATEWFDAKTSQLGHSAMKGLDGERYIMQSKQHDLSHSEILAIAKHLVDSQDKEKTQEHESPTVPRNKTEDKIGITQRGSGSQTKRPSKFGLDLIPTTQSIRKR